MVIPTTYALVEYRDELNLYRGATFKRWQVPAILESLKCRGIALAYVDDEATVLIPEALDYAGPE